ncbi:MAG: LON peptidase substrate-binding domain-containing protein, partial [Pseudomonadota bacterium]|nr:LON peptidase substrate-binding domain-containing protein [Pseudomonadota bacterium]
GQINMPIFPLRTVLFPGGILPLRIFEPRYVDMIRWCMREQATFGVVLLRQGSEVNTPADAAGNDRELFKIGTEAEIIDFNQADNGLLGIVAQGRRKFSIVDTREKKDGLLLASVQYLPEEAVGELTDEDETLVAVLKDLLQHPLIQQLNPEVDLQQARSVSYRLADLLPLEPEIKQALLQMNWPKERLSELRRLVGKFRG